MLSIICQICSRENSSLTVEISDKQWKELLFLVKRHRIEPLVYESIRKKNISVPKAIKEELKGLVRKNLFKGLLYASELNRINTRFESENIQYLCFKGLAISSLCGKDFSQRHVGDMDLLLIDSADLIRSITILRELNYHSEIISNINSAAEIERLLAQTNKKDFTFVNVDNGVTIELHIKLFTLFTTFPVSHEELYANREYIDIADNKIPCMGTQHHQLYLPIHGAHSRWFRLKWLFDIPMLDSVNGFYSDLDKNFETSAINNKYIFAQMMCLADDLLGIKAPISIADFRRKNIRLQWLIWFAKRCLIRKPISDFNRFESAVYGIMTESAYRPMLYDSPAVNYRDIKRRIIRSVTPRR